MRKRRAGILLHISSLPSNFGIGDLGPQAYNFLNFLKDTETEIWQILPYHPTGYGNSPYTAYSAFAGNELFISPEVLHQEGFLSELPESQVIDISATNPENVDYEKAGIFKWEVITKAYHQLQQSDFQLQPIRSMFPGEGSLHKITAKEDFAWFLNSEYFRFWLDDYALFRAIKNSLMNQCWSDWPEDLRTRENEALENWRTHNAQKVEVYAFAQYLFFRQWMALKKRANEMGITLFGDIPIFVSYDSADVWALPSLFHLNSKGKPITVAGVPPDYFSETGQRWGNPLYNWTALKKSGYAWWLERMRSMSLTVDWVRIDHFRGFEAFWQIKASEETAVLGSWKKGPGMSLFHAMKDVIGNLTIVAEDLGVITPEVEALRDRNGFPGMKILQFAFGSGADNIYLPHNHTPDSVVYTGTHDNDTTVGWYQKESAHTRVHICDYLGIDGQKIALQCMRAAWQSVADTAIVPMQDLMELDSTSRMNTPGTAAGNWCWRMVWEKLPPENCVYLRNLNRLTGRSSQESS